MKRKRSFEPKNTPAPPCTVVIFGGGGDLARRKLFPALYNLRKSALLPDDFAVIGIAREELDERAYRSKIGADLERRIARADLEPEARDWLLDRIHYVSGNLTDPKTYAAIATKLAKIASERGIRENALFYLATPPSLFSVIPNRLAEAGLLSERDDQGRWRRIIIEKPFGHDYDSARDLNQGLLKVAKEDQIYRIDHYLGKETVQNMMVLRFANGIFEPVWNHRFVDSVQVTVAESLGVEERGGYYDQSGALRDMVPNHLFQLVSLIGMEPPNSFDADDVRDEKVKVLKAIKPLSHEEVLSRVVRGQYGAGTIDGQICPPYRREPLVKPGSDTETFVAMKLEIDNWRWAGVPFYLRTGKRMQKRLTEVIIKFRCAPFQMFRDGNDLDADCMSSNLLVMQIQPNEMIRLRFTAKIPGPEVKLSEVSMDFNYVDYFGEAPRTGYETLLFDCMKGDATLFQRADQIEAGWQIVQPVLDVWHALKPRDFPDYAAGSWGPEAASELLSRDGRAWMVINGAQVKQKPEKAAERGVA